MAKRREPVRASDDRQRSGTPGSRAKPPPSDARAAQPRTPRAPRPTREQRPRATPGRRPARCRGPPRDRSRPKNAAQAKARAKARKAKAPKVVRPPLRERLLVRLSSIDLDPRRFVDQGAVRGAGDRRAGTRARRHPVAVDRRRRALLRAGPRPSGESGSAATEGRPRARRARGAGGARPRRGGPQSRHDPVQGHRAPGAGSDRQLVGRRHAQAGAGGAAAAAEQPAARARCRRRRHAPPAPRVVDPREVAVHLPPAPAPLPNPEVALPATVVGPSAVPAAPAPVAPAPTPPLRPSPRRTRAHPGSGRPGAAGSPGPHAASAARGLGAARPAARAPSRSLAAPVAGAPGMSRHGRRPHFARERRTRTPVAEGGRGTRRRSPSGTGVGNVGDPAGAGRRGGAAVHAAGPAAPQGLRAEAASQLKVTDVEEAVRGSIVDRNGDKLAFTTEARALTFQPAKVQKQLRRGAGEDARALPIRTSGSREIAKGVVRPAEQQARRRHPLQEAGEQGLLRLPRPRGRSGDLRRHHHEVPGGGRGTSGHPPVPGRLAGREHRRRHRLGRPRPARSRGLPRRQAGGHRRVGHLRPGFRRCRDPRQLPQPARRRQRLDDPAHHRRRHPVLRPAAGAAGQGTLRRQERLGGGPRREDR